jgi:hypothetical protein
MSIFLSSLSNYFAAFSTAGNSDKWRLIASVKSPAIVTETLAALAL